MLKRLNRLIRNPGRLVRLTKRIVAAVLILAAATLVSVPVPLGNLQPAATDDLSANDPSIGVFAPHANAPEGKYFGKKTDIPIITNITALKTEGKAVAPDSEFLLTCSMDPGESNLGDSIQVSPQKPYTVTKAANKTYLLAFEEALDQNSMVTFSLTSSAKPKSWAFQTKTEFSVVQSFPADGATRVPCNTGIEIAFSHMDLTNFEEFFHIEPSVQGRFEQHAKTFVFVPERLQRDTLYTVTINNGLKTGDGQTLVEDHIFSFRTEEIYPTDHSYFMQGSEWETFLPDAVPVVEVSASEQFNDAEFTVQVYKFSDDAAYINALKERHTYNQKQLNYRVDSNVPVSGMQKVIDTTTKLIRVSEYWWIPSYIVLPDLLPEGYYLIDIKAPSAKVQCSTHIQKFVQVHPYAVYALSVDGTELVWVNDAVSGTPVSGAEVWINDNSAETNAEGLTQIQTPAAKENDFHVLSVKSDRLPFVSPVSLTSDSTAQDINEKFYTYIYTDRERYQPSDTVKVWGIVMPKDGSSKPPKDAELQLQVGYWYYDQETIAPITKKVILDASGAFSGEISFQGLSASYYQVKLVADGVTYSTKGIEVGEYTKPSYVIQTSFDRPVYYAWDPIMLTVNASFFDGTPAANTKFEVYSASTSNTSSGTTDYSGSFAVNVGYSDRYNSSWRPQYCYYAATTAGAEDVKVQSSGYYYVVPRDVMLEAKYHRLADGYSLDIRTNRIDISSIKSKSELFDNNYESLRSSAINLPISVTLVEVTWTKTQVGTYYDFINKVTLPKYEYIRSEKEIQTLTGTTKDGVLTFAGLDLQMSQEKYFYAKIACKDTRGQQIVENVHFYQADEPRKSQIMDFRFYCTKDKFSVGETANIVLQESRQPYEGTGKVLSIVVQNNLKSFRIVDGLSFSIPFQEADIPNISIYGAYFDGKRIYPVNRAFLMYDPSERLLAVETVTDRDKYSPGDMVNADIFVTDETGKPISGAAVCMSIVDEAAFAVADQNIDPLNTIYSRYFYPDCLVFTSYTQHDFSGEYMEGGGGEGGPDGVRRNFLDTAAFLTAVTDNTGRARFTFQIPDNLTSWRVTTVAASDGIYAGHSRINIVTSLPVFVDLLVNKVFLHGDDLSASVRAFGTALHSNEKVSFTAELQLPDGTKKELTGSGTQGSYVNFNFGSGPEGEYVLTVTAKAKSGSDAIQKGFRVVSSALEIPMSKTFSLVDGVDLQALRSPVTLMFYDPANKLYYDSLMKLASAYGIRADVRASRMAAQELLKESFGSDLPYYYYGTQIEELEPGALQNYLGGVRMLDYSEPEPELTALVCAAAPQYLNTDNAASYLFGVIQNRKSQPEDVAAAYMGLAALHRPVLLDIQYLLSHQESLPLKARLYLTAGLAMIGDQGTASEYYNEMIRPLLRKGYSGVYMDTKNQVDTKNQAQPALTSFEATALASITAVKIGAVSADSMIQYLLSNPSNESTAYLQFLIYANQNRSVVKNSASSFSYQLDGKVRTVTLNQHKPYILSLPVEALEQADFKVIRGNPSVCATYIGSAADVIDPGSEEITLKKTYEAMDGKPIAQSALIKITISVNFANAPKGWYELSDYIPSGARYSSYQTFYKSNWWLNQLEGQRITFCVKNIEPKDLEYMTNTPIVYYVRATLTGEFITDNAYIRHTKFSAWGRSERGELLISEE